MRSVFAAFAILTAVAGIAQAQSTGGRGLLLAEKFGSLEAVGQMSMAPDAGKVAWLGTNGEDQFLYVADLVANTGPKAVLRVGADKGAVTWCRWASVVRLVCQVKTVVNDAGVLLGFSRLIALDADGKNLVRLTQEINSRSLGEIQDGGDVLDWDAPGPPGQVLMTREYVPESTIGTNFRNTADGLGVDIVDTKSLKRARVEAPRQMAVEYITDGHGTVRIMALQGENSSGFSSNKLKYFYRRPDSRDWEMLSTVGLTDDVEGGFSPVAVDPASNVVYGFDSEKGMTALFSIKLDGSGQRKLVLGRSDVDIDHVVTIGRNRRVVGASYATERRVVEYFDPDLKALGASLTKVLPGNPNIDFIDASEDESKLLLLAWGDTNPGMVYLFDKSSMRVEEILPVRTELDGLTLAKVTPVTFEAADGTKIPAYLTLPPGSSGKGLPAIVMPHGGPSARDEWGFDWLAQFFAARGYAVLQPNFRGSAGYGADWYQQNGFKSWRIAISDVNDAGRWLVKQGIAAPDKLGIVGWSYGGYAALQSQVLDPDLFKAVIAIAPVTDLERLRQEAAPYTNFSIVDRFIGTGPHVREGSPAQNAARFKAPVLLFHGTMDQNVGSGESRLMADRLRSAGKPVTYVEFKGLGHNLNSKKARTQMLSQSDAFLRKTFGLPED